MAHKHHWRKRRMTGFNVDWCSECKCGKYILDRDSYGRLDVAARKRALADLDHPTIEGAVVKERERRQDQKLARLLRKYANALAAYTRYDDGYGLVSNKIRHLHHRMTVAHTAMIAAVAAERGRAKR